MKCSAIMLHGASYYKKASFNRELVTKRIHHFEPTKFLGFTVGWKVSQEKLNWEQERSLFNKSLKSSKEIDYQMLADCFAWSYHNISESILFARGNAYPEVVDMFATFRDYLK